MWRRAPFKPAVSHGSSLIFRGFFAGWRKGGLCPLYPEQRRQHGHLYTSSKCEFTGCPFSPLAFPQSVLFPLTEALWPQSIWHSISLITRRLGMHWDLTYRYIFDKMYLSQGLTQSTAKKVFTYYLKKQTQVYSKGISL